ncbi:piwi-like protein Siwi [Rhopalosiphum maidis]|uniref:piwi-like protein Siwi n=1 Tax=Rhopalosiphum maidis TaxID=43146 RepID=UPI000EFFC45C|nr:piwi-like protein Siwi [Rhopalosiphum maidis]
MFPNNMQFPPFPEPKQGCSGKSVELLANYFPIVSITDRFPCLYQYRVDFNPDEQIISIKTELLAQHQQRLGLYLFDGTMLFSIRQYDLNNFELTSTRRSDGQAINIKLQIVDSVQIDEDASIQALNILLPKCLKLMKLTPIGRQFYDLNSKIVMAQYKLQLCRGYDAEINSYENDLLVRVDLSNKPISRSTVLDLLNEFYVDRIRNKNWMISFKNSVVGNTVMTIYNNKTYVIDDIDENAGPNSEFCKNDQSIVTYRQYYREKWNRNILNSNQPLLISKKENSVQQLGVDDKLVYLIPELCVMTGITDSMRNNYTLMKDIALHNRLYPREWMERLTNFADDFHINSDCIAELSKWNLTLNKKLMEVTGRILRPQKILCRSTKYNSGEEGDWTNKLQSVPMFTSAVVKHWVILTPRNFCEDVDVFTQNIIQAARNMSFYLPKPVLVPMNDGRSNTFINNIDEIIHRINPEFILCIISSWNCLIYRTIKRKLCIDRAVPSQVVILNNVKTNDLSICTKIAIQINCKLGGIPWLVPISKIGMMIVGCNTYEDNQRKNKSFGALIASLDNNHSTFFNNVETYENLQELSTNFAIGIIKALSKYRSKNGTLPTSIIIYRDGVREGQSSHIRMTEVKLVQAACQRVYGSNSVPFTFVIVTRNNHSKFFVRGVRGFENPRIGTIVDSDVIDPNKYEFFLISQPVKQGSVTPTHYEAIEDTNDFLPDTLQKITFKLTHNYFNWSGTIRVPAPCQLAHKLAYFTGETLGCSPNPGLDESLFFL